MLYLRLHKNVWQQLLLFNALMGLTFSFARFGMMIAVQVARQGGNVEDAKCAVFYVTGFFKWVELIGMFLSQATHCALFFTLRVMRKHCEEFLMPPMKNIRKDRRKKESRKDKKD